MFDRWIEVTCEVPWGCEGGDRIGRAEMLNNDKLEDELAPTCRSCRVVSESSVPPCYPYPYPYDLAILFLLSSSFFPFFPSSYHIGRLRRLLLEVGIGSSSCLIWRRILVLKLYWSACLWLVRSVLLIVRRHGVLRVRGWRRCARVERWRVVTTLSSLLGASVTNDRIDQKTDKGKTKGKLAYCTGAKCLAFVHVQHEDTEANANCACSSSNCDKVHDQDTSPEASLEGVHGQERAWFECIAQEKHNCQQIQQKDNDNEQHEDDNGPIFL